MARDVAIGAAALHPAEPVEAGPGPVGVVHGARVAPVAQPVVEAIRQPDADARLTPDHRLDDDVPGEVDQPVRVTLAFTVEAGEQLTVIAVPAA